jgi:recombination protein RecA
MSNNKDFLKAFNKAFSKNGTDAARKASDPQAYKGEVIEFPSLTLGDASHYWGLPLGKITQFHGPEGCGKTFFAMLMVKQAQDKYPGSSVVWFDAEYSFNETWAKNLGIDTDRLVIVPENNAAVIFTMICGRSNDQGKKIDLGILDHVGGKTLDCKLIVLDSIANLIYPIEENRGFDEQEMAAGARFLMKGMKRTTPMLAETGTSFLCINQAREKIGERIPTLTYPGGRPYRHTLSLAVLFKASGSKDGQIQSENERKQGHKILATVEKTRAGPDKWKSEFWLDFSKGVVNRGAEAAMLGDAYGIISRPNAVTWIYEDLTVKGKDAFAAALEARPDLVEKLIAHIQEIKTSGNGRPAVLSEDDTGPVSDFEVGDSGEVA